MVKMYGSKKDLLKYCQTIGMSVENALKFIKQKSNGGYRLISVEEAMRLMPPTNPGEVNDE